MEHLYAGLKLLTMPTGSSWQRNWRAAYFEKVAIQNKSALNNNRSDYSPLARVLTSICKRDPNQDVVSSAVIALRKPDWNTNPEWNMFRLTNYSWLREKVKDENLDLAAAIFLVALGASLRCALMGLPKYQQSKLTCLHFRLLEALVAVEKLAHRDVDDRDAAAARRLLDINGHFV